MKIAIFGGSFNPVHNEHVNIVRAAVKALNLDKVIILPSFITPKKDGRLTATAQQRLEMCRLAFNEVDRAEVSGYEITRGGVSYSYITCEEFAKKYPADERYFILGADMLDDFLNWKNPERILSAVKLAVCARVDGEGLRTSLKNFEARFKTKPVSFNYVGKDVSSTRLRTLLALGEEPAGLNAEVYGYIKRNNIYAIPRLAEVKNLLTEKRWKHTVGVCLMAAQNCRRVGASEEQAITAAALHDCAKYLTAESPLLKGFKCPDGVPGQVVHQYASAYVAGREFKVTDKDIINSIKYHTSGRAGMSGLEKLIYLCDMLEDGRDFDGVEALRAVFAKDIDECLLAALKHQINYLNNSGEKIYPLTLETYEYLKGTKNDQ
ncbi:MAG: nicotinate (nicotinamide) nucleotide adenylyltransferase [Clostridia bacterium]|nr:nicotinate (nicotinamide) nucleotide adenylyltransferase [Clostridia bacterium]